MKDKLNPCVYYVCAGADCTKGRKNVTLAKCKNCNKYKARKNNHRPEPVKLRRQKDKDRHDNWKNY